MLRQVNPCPPCPWNHDGCVSGLRGGSAPRTETYTEENEHESDVGCGCRGGVVWLVAGMAGAQDAAALAQKSGCMNCHAVDTKKMGPSFKDAAAKLKGKSDAEVVAALKAAKPHASVKASDDDLKAIGKWIQSL